jgi:tRNA 2-thiouridine synthesizing protein A
MNLIDEADHILDASGLYCPEPVMLLHNRIREIAAGETLLVLSTDPASTRDIPKFCHFLDHRLLHQDENGGQYRFLLRKAGGDERGESG